ncbi:MAG: hypothetical protein FWF96_00910 [Kiritimatiellaeota bacterium]|nr:hypothetical protein [Kiritimatiellota bacterium]
MDDFRQKVQDEVDRNFDFFNKELPRLMPRHQGQYALLKDANVVEFFDTFRDARKYAGLKYPDHLYSIQKVADTVVNLGFWSTQLCLSPACKS